MDRKQISAPAIPLFRAPFRDMATECNTAVGSILGYKDVLRCAFDSEECKIDTAKAKSLKSLVEELCTIRNEEFVKYYCIIEKDVALLKQNNKSSFKDMYKYCAETISRYLKGMDINAEYNNPILWQVRVACPHMHVSCVARRYTVLFLLP